jgi:molybdopterin synthase sulfur carrier subunit
MHIEVIFFGQLVDKVGCSTTRMINPGTIAAFKKAIVEQYPLLKQTKYTIALNNKIAEDTETIQEHDKIALMPPFSGG